MAYPNLSSSVLVLVGKQDGPTLTAAAAASCLPTPERLVLNSGWFIAGKRWRLAVRGRISCAITTPGTARFDLRLGPSGNIVVFDTGQISLNINGKSNVPFWLDVDLDVRTIGAGTTTQLFGMGRLQSEAIVGSVSTSNGGNSSLLVPVQNPAVGNGFDNTAQNVIDLFYTQIVGTGSMTVHQACLEELV